MLNTPRPWFAFGDMGASSSHGGYVRVVGEAITVAAGHEVSPPVLRLTDAGKAWKVTARLMTDSKQIVPKLTRWHAWFNLPDTIPPGNYTLAISNFGDEFVPLCTFIDSATPCLSDWQINEPTARVLPWKSDVFTVLAEQPGVGRDATAAVNAAIAKAASNGGGVVYFPAGQYFVKDPFVVAPGTVLRGDSRETVSVYFAEANESSAPPAYVTSIEGGSWGVEEMTFYVTAFAHNIVQFKPGTDGAFMRRCRIRFASYFCLEPEEGKGSRGRTSSWDHAVGTAVMLAGTNLFIEDNDIHSSGDVVSTLNNGAVGASYMSIARNR